jgi:hypothetical protein
MSSRNADDFSLEDRAHTLSELADIVAPRTYDYWLLAADLLAELPPPRAAVVTSDQVDLASVLDWTPGSPIRLKAGVVRNSQDASSVRRGEIEGRRETLFKRIAARIRDAIASPRCFTAGIGPAGTLIEIPRELANQVVINLEHNTLSTMDGGMVWRGVVVRTPIAANAADAIAPRRTAGAKRSKREAVKTFLRETYPDGIPSAVKNETLVGDIAGALDLRVNEITVRRALRELRQNTDK